MTKWSLQSSERGEQCTADHSAVQKTTLLSEPLNFAVYCCGNGNNIKLALKASRRIKKLTNACHNNHIKRHSSVLLTILSTEGIRSPEKKVIKVTVLRNVLWKALPNDKHYKG